jgi:hypothetical protein
MSRIMTGEKEDAKITGAKGGMISKKPSNGWKQGTDTY